MLLDAFNQIANAYSSLTVGTTNVAVAGGYWLDRITAQEDGAGNDIVIYLRVNTAFTTGAGATVAFNLLGSTADPTFASVQETIPLLAPTAAATLAAGVQIARIKLPRFPLIAGSLEPSPDFIRYWTLQQVVAVGVLTAGASDCWFTMDPLQDNISYASAYTV